MAELSPPGTWSPKPRTRRPVAVIGLGEFGSALATSLTALGHEVLAVDVDAEVVQLHAALVTQVVQADATNLAVLRQLAIDELDTVFVAIGGLEDSALTTAALVGLGVDDIWVKAAKAVHGEILSRVGAHHVVYPERDTGRQLAGLFSGQALAFLALDDELCLVEVRVPPDLVGRRVGDLDPASNSGVQIVFVKPAGGSFLRATPDLVLGKADLVVVAGPKAVLSYDGQA